MSEAARRLGLSRGDAAKRLLEQQGVAVHRVSERALAVDAEDVERLAQARRDSGYRGRGRPSPRKTFTAAACHEENALEVAA